MNALSLIVILLAGGVGGFLLYAGQALVIWAKRPVAPKHEHKWTEFSSMEVHPRGRAEVLAGAMYGLRCEKCGDITQRYVGLR